MEQLENLFNNTLMAVPEYVKWTDIVEILIISFLAYNVMVWIKNTRAWSLLKGIVVIAVFILIAVLFRMNTILWIARNITVVAVTAVIVILQPELRKALEELGRKNILSSIIPFENSKVESGRFSDATIGEIARACVEMSRVKTGALIVVEQKNTLRDYERTGIDIDAVVSSQLLINIFEHNTPLHDGAVIIRGNRIVSATCYLPLSDNMALSKELGTRHRAGIGISEVTDSMTIIVSEETGKISIAYEGEMERNVDVERLKISLGIVQDKPTEEKKVKRRKSKPKTEKG
ncbi:MAG: diadenylate cyclase CdaA [Lachnospiraceae bacterium]|jgi:diadenylate cyclase|nr:diadenylate cyclase CdaA [Lachnospiraceae bacterium]